MADVKLIGEDERSWTNTFTYNYAFFFRYSAVVSGSLNSIRVKSSKSASIKVALYSDSGGEPGSRLTAAEADVVDGWNTINMPNINIVLGTYYWIAFNSNSNIVYRISGNAPRRYKSATYSSYSFPDPAGSGYTDDSGYFPALAGWGAESSGCPRQAMYYKMLG